MKVNIKILCEAGSIDNDSSHGPKTAYNILKWERIVYFGRRGLCRTCSNCKLLIKFKFPCSDWVNACARLLIVKVNDLSSYPLKSWRKTSQSFYVQKIGKQAVLVFSKGPVFDIDIHCFACAVYCMRWQKYDLSTW